MQSPNSMASMPQEYFLAEFLLNALKDDRYEDWDKSALNDETMEFFTQMLVKEWDKSRLLDVMTRWARGDRITVTRLAGYDKREAGSPARGVVRQVTGTRSCIEPEMNGT